MTLIGMMFMLMVVKNDEDVDGNTGRKKSRTANKAELNDLNWDDVHVDGGEK